MLFTLAQTVSPFLAQADPSAETSPDAPADGAAPGADPAPGDVVRDLTGEAKQDALNAWEGLMQGDLAASWPLIEKYVLPLGLAILILVGTFIAAKVVSRMAGNAIRRAKVDETLSRFFAKLVFYAVVVFGVLAAMNTVGLQVTGFAAILASVGFAIGMAMSGTLANFAAGVMLLIFRPFRVGDVISAAGVTAKVNAIELFTTTFDTFDNRRFIVPNAKIFDDVIENITHHGQRRVDVNVGVEYSADLDKTREVLSAAAESLKDKMIEGEGRGFQVYLLDLGDSSVNWVVRFWTNAADFWPVKEQLTRAVKMHLDEAGLGIPFPQMDVHLDGKLDG